MTRLPAPPAPARLLLGTAGLAAALAAGWAWSRLEYGQPQAVRLARDYAASQAGLAASGCPAQELAPTGVHPPQTNGNRLRRRLAGVEVELPQLNVRLEGREGPCLLTVTLRYGADGWRVRRLQRTAG